MNAPRVSLLPCLLAKQLEVDPHNPPSPSDAKPLLALCHASCPVPPASCLCLRPQRNCRAAKRTPSLKTLEGARFTTFEVHHRIQSPSHHVLATGIAALRADGSSPACFPRPDPRLRRPGRQREGAAPDRPLRPRRHLCHCSGTRAPDHPIGPTFWTFCGGFAIGVVVPGTQLPVGRGRGNKKQTQLTCVILPFK